MENHSSRTSRWVLGVVAVSTLAFAVPVIGVEYPVTDLGRLDPEPNYPAIPLSMNSSGHIVGSSSVEVTYLLIFHYWLPRAFRWVDGSIYDLGTLPGSGTLGISAARCVNDANQVVGVNIGTLPGLGGDSLHNHAFLWQNGAITDLGSMTADPNDISVGFAINNGGHTVGAWMLNAEPNVPHAYVRWQSGAVTSLGTFGGSTSFAWDINDSNQIVGTARDISEQNRAFLWQDGVMTDLGVLPGYEDSTQALAINESGQVMGISSDANGVIHSFLWEDGSMTDLGVLPGRPSTVAAAISDNGVVVGAAADPNGESHAFLWNNGAIHDLNSVVDPSSGWLLTAATAINKTGQIAGTGKLNGLAKGFLMKVYALSLTLETANQGSVQVDPNAAFFEPNATVILTPNANEGKKFDSWSGDVPVGHETDNPLTITMDSSKAITANFKCGSGLEPMLPLIVVGLLALMAIRRWRS